MRLMGNTTSPRPVSEPAMDRADTAKSSASTPPQQPSPTPTPGSTPSHGSPPAVAPPGSCPLSPQDQQALLTATRLAFRLHKAAALALFNGVSCGVFAVGCLVMAFTGLEALVMGIGLAAVSWNELRCRKLLRQFDPHALRQLTWNQLAIMGLMVFYCLWQIVHGLTGPNPYQPYIANDPQLAKHLGPIAELHVVLTVVFYLGVLAGSVIFQGMNAYYYWSRQPLLRNYVVYTPTWIADLHRTLFHNK